MADIRQNSVIRDVFDRVENPLSFGGKWAHVDAAYSNMEDDGTRAKDPAGGPDYAWAYWTPDTWDGDDAEAWACVYASSGPTLAWDMLLLKDTSVGGSSAVDGYLFRYGRTTGGAYYELYKLTNAGGALIDGDIFDHSIGDATTCLIRRNGGDVEGWVSLDSGANWVLAVNASEGSYTTGLKGGIAVFGGTAGWTCFGGGPPIKRLRQVMRYR